MLENLPGHSMTIDYNRRTEHDGEELAVATPNEMEALANKAVEGAKKPEAAAAGEGDDE